jgi:RNA polymerase sigma-70 factor (ECF subfamily)
MRRMGDQVATTQWSLVVAARDGTGTEARFAMEHLCSTYWAPLYAFVRHQGHGPDQARDLTQAYFAELLEKEFLADVDADKGRFRSFLFASMRNFLSHQRDRERALKRGGDAVTLSLDVAAAERSYIQHATSDMSPDEVFEYRWAMTVISRALDRLRDDAERAGTERQFEALRPYLTSFEVHAPYKEVAAELGFSEGAVKVAVHRLRRRFGGCLRAELSDTVADRSDVDRELRHLLAVVRG